MGVRPDTYEMPLVWTENRLLKTWEYDPGKIVASLGGEPVAIICSPGRKTRYKKLGARMGLNVFESKEVRRRDGFVLIHAGEIQQWLPGYRS